MTEPDGVYDPGPISGRFLFGSNGIMNEFELTLMRQRSPVGYLAKRRVVENFNSAYPLSIVGPFLAFREEGVRAPFVRLERSLTKVAQKRPKAGAELPAGRADGKRIRKGSGVGNFQPAKWGNSTGEMGEISTSVDTNPGFSIQTRDPLRENGHILDIRMTALYTNDRALKTFYPF